MNSLAHPRLGTSTSASPPPLKMVIRFTRFCSMSSSSRAYEMVWSPTIGTVRCGNIRSFSSRHCVWTKWPTSPSYSSVGTRRNHPSTRSHSPVRRARPTRWRRSVRASHSSIRARVVSGIHGFFRQSQPICSAHHTTSGNRVGPRDTGLSGWGMTMGNPLGP